MPELFPAELLLTCSQVLTTCVSRSATCAKMGRHQDALSDAEEAVKCDATFVKGYLRRAAAHEALKNWDDAVRDYEKVHILVALPRAVDQNIGNEEQENETAC